MGENKKIITAIKKNKKNIAAFAMAAVIFTGSGIAIQKHLLGDKATDVSIESVQLDDDNRFFNEDELSFNPNVINEETVNNLASLQIDALYKGVELTPEQVLYLYLSFNLDRIDIDTLSALEMSNRDFPQILNEVNISLNKIMDDTTTSMPNTIINFSPIIAEKDMDEKIQSLQYKVAMFNASDDKKVISNNLNQSIEEEFVTSSEFKEIGAFGNVFRVKLLEGLLNRTIVNNSYRVPNVSNTSRIFATNNDCNLTSDKIDNSIFNTEKTIYKSSFNKKLEYSIIKSSVSNENNKNVEFTFDELVKMISEKVKESGAVLIPNPNLEQTILAEAPKTPAGSVVTQKELDSLKTDPKTGEKFIPRNEPTEKEKKAAIRAEEKRLEKENEAEEKRAEEVEIREQNYYDDGYEDGLNGDDMDNRYKKHSSYRLGYQDGSLIRENTTTETEVEYIPHENTNKTNQSQEQSNNNSNNNNDNNNNTENNSTGNSTDVEIEIIPEDGFKVGDDGAIYDEHGNEVEILEDYNPEITTSSVEPSIQEQIEMMNQFKTMISDIDSFENDVKDNEEFSR